jgi:hypothetical protein
MQSCNKNDAISSDGTILTSHTPSLPVGPKDTFPCLTTKILLEQQNRVPSLDCFLYNELQSLVTGYPDWLGKYDTWRVSWHFEKAPDDGSMVDVLFLE